MKLVKEITALLLLCTLIGCENDDVDTVVEEDEVVQVTPSFAVVGVDLTNGNDGNVVTWTEDFQVASTLNLREELDFQFGVLKNTIGSELAIATGFQTESIIYYDVRTGQSRTIENFFNPENPVAESFTTNTSSSILNYYLDANTSCCDIYLNTFNLSSEEVTEVFLGNGDIAPVQLNVLARGERTFAIAFDTFTGRRELFVHNAVTGMPIGVLDIDQFGGFMYNDARDEAYLFDFTGSSLSHITLDIETFLPSEATSFPPGFLISDGINDGQYSDNEIVFKDPQGIISNIYSFDTDSIVRYDAVDLINRIFEATGRGITITNTSVDLSTNSYIVLGTYIEGTSTRGIAVALTLDREVFVVAESGNIRPDTVVFLNQ